MTPAKLATWKRNNDLGIAVFRGEVDNVKSLLKEGGNPNFVNDLTKGSVLMTASQKGQAEIVRILLAAGSDANYEAPNGDNALQSASDQGHNEIIEMLVTVGGAAIDAQDSDGNTSLISASLSGRLESVRLLLRLGANPSIVASQNTSALSVSRRPEITALLQARIAELAAR